MDIRGDKGIQKTDVDGQINGSSVLKKKGTEETSAPVARLSCVLRLKSYVFLHYNTLNSIRRLSSRFLSEVLGTENWVSP